MSDQNESRPKREYLPRVHPEAREAADKAVRRANDVIGGILGASVVSEEVVTVLHPDYVDESLLDKDPLNSSIDHADYQQYPNVDGITEQQEPSQTPSV